MTTDIHDLDQYIRKYVDIDDSGHGGASGYVVDIDDNVTYSQGPSRWITLDWGQGWLIRPTTRIAVIEPPPGTEVPMVGNPIDIIHAQMDGRPCPGPDCVNRERAPKAMRALRAWRARQSDQYWIHHFVRPLKSFLGDPSAVDDLLREARSEGAPPHVVERMESMTNRRGVTS